MRIDSHHSFSERYSLSYLETILKRNRFEGSVLVAPPVEGLPEFVKGVVAPDVALVGYPRVCGVIHDFTGGAIPDWLGEMERQGLTLDVLHGLRLVPRIAEAHPRLRIAIDHLGSPPFDGWQGLIEEAARFPKVCCKLSGLLAIQEARGYVRHAMAVFGPDRLMFGSDWPNSLPERTWKENLAVFTQAIGAQTIEVREAMLGGTAARFYGLTAG